MIAAVILAAGESRRMGRLKQVLSWGDRTVVEAAVDAALGAPEVDVVVAVLGHEAEMVEAALRSRPRPRMRVAANPDYRLGMLSSVKAGVRALEPGVEALLVALADQPAIRPEDYSMVVQAYRRARPRADIVVPTFGGKGGHPTLFAGALRQEVLELPYSGQGLRDLVRGHEGRVARVEMGERAVVDDLDTIEDYTRALENMHLDRARHGEGTRS
ncbi:MAG: nucleotidyltransferase family protein [Bacteroidota bacterium]